MKSGRSSDSLNMQIIIRPFVEYVNNYLNYLYFVKYKNNLFSKNSSFFEYVNNLFNEGNYFIDYIRKLWKENNYFVNENCFLLNA